MSFYVGQKVVCVDDADQRKELGEPVVRGKVYVVRELNDCACNRYYGRPFGVAVIGSRGVFGRGICGAEHERYIKSSRFRPLSELKEEARKRQQQEATV